MKSIYIIILVIVVATAFYGFTVYHNNQPKANIGVGARGQSDRFGNKEGEIPQSGDPCGGTGGTGQIVSVGNNTFIIKLNRDGRTLKKGDSQIIDLTGQTTIKTSTGSGSVSDLKIGKNVTIGGKPNPDGSLNATIVVICNGTGPNTQWAL